MINFILLRFRRNTLWLRWCIKSFPTLFGMCNLMLVMFMVWISHSILTIHTRGDRDLRKLSLPYEFDNRKIINIETFVTLLSLVCRHKLHLFYFKVAALDIWAWKKNQKKLISPNLGLNFIKTRFIHWLILCAKPTYKWTGVKKNLYILWHNF